MERFAHLIRAFLANPWAIDEESLAWAAILDVLSMRASGIRLTEDEIQARIDAAATGPRSNLGRDGTVAIVPLYGVISPRMNLMSSMSGGTTAEGFVRSLRSAVNNPEVDAILIDVDSPGGNVQGITEAAAAVRDAAAQKPVSAIANHDAYSAAYWAISGATEIVVTPSGGVGSIGIIGAHQDISRAQEMAGVKTTLISAGKFKTEGNPYGPLEDDARAQMQRRADAFMGKFEGDVAAGRHTTLAKVRANFGQGRTVLADDAFAAGMVDRIDTFENTVRRLGTGAVKVGQTNVPVQPTDDTQAVAAGEAAPEDTPADDAEPTTPDAPAEAGSTPSVAARRRTDLELIEAGLRGGHGWLQ